VSAGRARFLAVAAVVFAAAALVAVGGALAHVGSAYLAGGAPGYGELAHGDYLQTSWRIWLFGHQLEHGRAPWVDPFSFQPESPHQTGLGGWPFGLLFWPVYAALGAVLAWNVFTLVALAAAGALACWWLRELGIGRVGALVGGLAFELAPYRLEQSTGHLLGPISLLLPLALACFERGLRRGWRWHGGAAVALASIPLSGQVHLALGAVPFFALYAVCRTRARGALVAAGCAVAAAALCGIWIQHEVIARSIVAGGRNLHALSQYSAWPVDFVSRSRQRGAEQFVFLGWITVAAAVAGVVLLARERRRGLAVALGLGVVLPAAAALGSHFFAYRFLWHHASVLRYARVPERTLPIACLCLAALAGVVVDRLAGRWPRRTVLVGAAALALVAADLHVSVFRASAADSGNEAYRALAHEGPGRLLELPVTRPSDDLGSVYLGYERQALRERPLGYSTVARPIAEDTARALWPLNCGVVSGRELGLLDALGVAYVTVHSGLFALRKHPRLVVAARAGLRDAGFRPIARGGVVELWRLEARPRPNHRTPSSECKAWEQNAF
jgi:hypothetical protein